MLGGGKSENKNNLSWHFIGAPGKMLLLRGVGRKFDYFLYNMAGWIEVLFR